MPSIDPLFNRPMSLWRGVNAKPQRTLSVRPDYTPGTRCVSQTPLPSPSREKYMYRTFFFLLSALFFGGLFCLVVLNS